VHRAQLKLQWFSPQSLSDNLMASPTNPVNPTRANPTDTNPTDANLKPYSKYVIQCADFIFSRKPQLKIRGKRIYGALYCHTLGQPLFVPRF
jgi:hypothetical protein